MKIQCPSCGNSITVNHLGRKSYNIAFTKVCKALVATKNKDGSPNYSAAARWLASEQDRTISSGYIWTQIQQETEARQISREELLREVLESGDKAIAGDN